MVAPGTLAALAAVLGALVASPGQTSPSTMPTNAVPVCSSDYAGGADLDEQLARARRDVLACAHRGGVAPHVARRALAAIATLRDTSQYDQRRGWGNLTNRQRRRGSARLARVMRSAGI